MNVSYEVGEERASSRLWSVYRVYSVSIDNILMWIYEVWYSTRWFTIVYVRVLSVGDGVKRLPRRIIRQRSHHSNELPKGKHVAWTQVMR
jgi:hypothetical protein